MTQTELFGLVTFLLMLVGALSGVWWRIEGKIGESEKRSSTQAGAALGESKLAMDKLNEFKIEAAHTYATKDESVAATDRLMAAINDVGTRVDRKLDSMTDRLDRVIEGRTKD